MKIIFNQKEIEPVQVGDRYRWVKTVQCRSGAIQRQDSIMKVVNFTTKPALEEISESGVNWICLDGNGTTSEWSTLEACISRGVLIKVK